MNLPGLVIHSDRRDEVKEQVRAAGEAAIKTAADELLRVANETVPREESILASDSVAEVDPGSDPPVGQVGYGIGEAKAYAVRQHEETGWRHDGGQRAKWLEMATKENAKRLGAVIAAEMKGKLA